MYNAELLDGVQLFFFMGEGFWGGCGGRAISHMALCCESPWAEAARLH